MHTWPIAAYYALGEVPVYNAREYLSFEWLGETHFGRLCGVVAGSSGSSPDRQVTRGARGGKTGTVSLARVV